MNRIRICGQITHRYEQIIERSDEELKGLREELNIAKNKGDQAINDYLGEDYGDTDPVDWKCNEWSAELIDANGQIIESLDAY